MTDSKEKGYIKSFGLFLVTLGCVGLLVAIGMHLAEITTDQTVPPSSPPVASQIEALPDYQVVGRTMINGAEVVEVKTVAPVGRLTDIAATILVTETFKQPKMIRILFYFPEESPGDIVPRYRIEWAKGDMRSTDLTDQRKSKNLRI